MPRPDVRPDSLTSWHHDWSGLRTAVLGLGMTGFSVADTLVELGASVLVIAESASPERTQLLEVIGGTLLLDPDGSLGLERLEAFVPELVVVSPGYHPDHPLLVWAAQAGVPIWGDIELAWRLRDKVGAPAEWISVTGTNGKTTTTGLTAAMLRAEGLRVAACGNIGVPVLDAIRDPEGFDALVVELSSYQLHWMRGVSPLASVCLNIADDHLDWHGSAEAYRLAKGKVYENTRIACVYNRADEATMHLVEDAEVIDGARAVGFGLDVPGPSDFGVVDGILVDRAFLAERRDSALEIATVGELRERGLAAPHVVANILAASALARAAGVSIASIRAALREYRLDPHRIEVVADRDGVLWIDDSKATNPHAADASLGAFGSIVWVVGGLLKGVPIADLVERRASKLRAAIVIGADRQEVVSAFGRHAPELPLFEVVPSETEEVMQAAVRMAAEAARPGDVVLLAPAAASMDQFTDYADRGRAFAAAVSALLSETPEGGPDDRSDTGAPSDRDEAGGSRDPEAGIEEGAGGPEDGGSPEDSDASADASGAANPDDPSRPADS
ncbi:UDP-N-acetylmuramoyl-L-alanine--D-glutamate ligase [Amnibacterium flavum]|uniref:UDP-N-acetylmuramoylalanine--D-glutamate ligase n=1 Tax=Amnibacterium flavum TaxID=2173173 RepID=A0A2V1HQQ7_9MICO|nr:UDP-N-acetylmuramoyl-L-alanine--D-glutamate ligase [Amnibacterium flavum]PVZ94681.1 UDP-N-acetylmuramoyl-L-alanine--D-glutamate ligase [Amnibacterium flavum]